MELRHRLRSLAMIAALLASASTSANAASLLGSVVFDAGSGLYTYSYTLDNTAGSTVTDDFAVLILPNASLPRFDDFTTSTSPPGWAFAVSVGGLPSVFGTFFEWGDFGPCQTAATCSGVQPGASLSGFSVTLPFEPTGSLADNYFIFLPFGTESQFQLGNVVAPDVVATPLPPSLALFFGGLAFLGLLAGRRAFVSRCVSVA